MLEDSELLRISRIATNWPLLQQAHDGPLDKQPAARKELFNRYAPAVRTYLLKSLRNPDAADEVFQEFALRVVRGDFHRANPGRGRFRHLLKTVLHHLVADYWRREYRQPRGIGDNASELAAAETPELNDFEQAMVDNWRDEVMVRAWQMLEKAEQEGGPAFHSVLKIRTAEPNLKSPELAALLSKQLGKPITAVNLRKMLDRARHKLAQLIVELVVHARQPGTAQELIDELTDLRLNEYCLQAVAEWTPPPEVKK
jgi:DNA-directed RNA polymerase specialized sigma24 family protein